MRTSNIFQPKDSTSLSAFVAANPLAQVISAVGVDYEATPLPLVGKTDANGRITALIGHFARSNRQVAMLAEQPRAIVIFYGAHGYVSPSWMRDRSQAPTWNFETVHFVVDVELTDTAEQSASAIEALLDAVEGDGPERWHSRELGARYPKLLRGVVGFTAHVIEARVKFKLGQNERADVFDDIVAGLHRTGNAGLADAMIAASARWPRSDR